MNCLYHPRKLIHSLIAPYVIAVATILNVVFLKFGLSYFYLFLVSFFAIFLLIDYGVNFHKVKHSFLLYFIGVLVLFTVNVCNAPSLSSIYLLLRGFSVYLLFPLYWFIYFMHFNENDFWYMANKFIKTMAFIIAVCGIIQYFYSKTLFGLYDDSWSHNFSYSSLLQDYRLLFRVNSLLGSVQIYALFMAFSVIYYLETTRLSHYFHNDSQPLKMNKFLVLLFFIAGLLSGAKSFLLLLLLYYLISYFILKQRVKQLFVLATVFLVMFLLANTDLAKYRVINRLTDFSNILHQEQAQSGRIAIYKNLINHSIQNQTILIGDGPGTHMTLSGIHSEHIVAESYLLQIYVELGLIGLTFFLIFIGTSFFLTKKDVRISTLKKVLFIEIVSMLLVHGFNSPAMFLFWGPFLMPIRIHQA